MYVDESKTGLSFRSYENILLLGGGGHRTGHSAGAWRELSRFAKSCGRSILREGLNTPSYGFLLPASISANSIAPVIDEVMPHLLNPVST